MIIVEKIISFINFPINHITTQIKIQMKKILIAVVINLFTFACAANPDRPNWIDDPGVGAIGSAPFHVRGIYAQEELAMTRARARLAARYGVEISSVQDIQETVNNESSSVTSQRTIKEVMKNTTIRAQVKAKWHDKVKDVIYVWMVPLP